MCSVPDVPIDVKAFATGAESALIIWRPLSQSNGNVSQYNIFVREEGSKAEPREDIYFVNSSDKKRTQAKQISHEVSNLETNKQYEFWVTAHTSFGDSQPSIHAFAIPSDKIPLKIASFNDSYVANFLEDVELPCLAVGSPTPNITWKVCSQT